MKIEKRKIGVCCQTREGEKRDGGWRMIIFLGRRQRERVEDGCFLPSFLFVGTIHSVIPPLSTLIDVTNSLKKNHCKSKQHDGNANWLHRRHPGRADAGGLLLGGELRGPSDRKEVQHRRSEWALLLFKILDGSNYQQQQLEGELGTYNRSV